MTAGSSGREIAVIGMAGRFPGAETVDLFWENLKAGVESITPVTAEDLVSAGIDPSVLEDPDYVAAAACFDRPEHFDASFFGITPREAELMDPQHRAFLECAWAALEDAGYDARRYPGLIGVFAGVARNSYLLHNLASHPELRRDAGEYRLLFGNEKDYPATRVAYKLDLKGPAINVQTACSSSGVAVHLACQGLLTGDVDMALVGGCRVQVPIRTGYRYVPGGTLAPDGHVRAFDAEARGMVRGSGVALVVLKRLEDAIADGDTVHALILGSAVNNDGAAKAGFSAPSVQGQAAVISEALAVAEVSAETISYVEAHGTATILGDPIEIEALTRAFRETSKHRQYCAVGSVKTNIGHLDAGSCVAGMIKTILSLKHRLLPPSLHFRKPNPNINFKDSPFYVNGELREWRFDGGPLRAGVSSFGIGGTNVHVVLQEAPEPAPTAPSRPWQLVPLSARSPSALESARRSLAEHVAAQPQLEPADAAHTLGLGRRHFQHRLFALCSDRAGLAEALADRDARRIQRGQVPGQRPSVAFMFPGQGVQHLHMAAELHRHEPVFRQVLDDCARRLEPHLELDLVDLIYPGTRSTAASGEAAEALEDTVYAQPAIFIVEYALARLWMHWRVRPRALIGHSIGEYTAACLAGVFSLDDALKLVALRARLMASQPPGKMLSVCLSLAETEPLLGGPIALAANNAPLRQVLSGPGDAVDQLAQRLNERGVANRVLHTSHAYHSPMMDGVVEPFTDEVRRVSLRPPRIPMLSIPTGTWLTPEQATDPGYWGRQLRHPVRFSSGVETLGREERRILLEVGPGNTLASLVRQHDDGSGFVEVLSSLGHARQRQGDYRFLLEAVGRLWLWGCFDGWAELGGGERRRRISLPTYPFERKRYWLEPASPAESVATPVEAGMERPGTGMEEREPGKGDAMERTVMESSSSEGPAVPVSDQGQGRRKAIETGIREVFIELSGIDGDDLDDHRTFLEMGLDSLFLTQVSLALQRRFQLKVSLRMLLDDAGTLADLTDYLDGQLPPTAFADPSGDAGGQAPRDETGPGSGPGGDRGRESASVSTPPLPAAGSYDGAADPSVAERVIFQQLEVMREQLAVLGMPGAEPGQAVPQEAKRAASLPARESGPMEAEGRAPKPAKRFGPHKPIETRKGGALSSRQQEHLDALIQRYTRKTRRSRDMTQEHRPHFADPRAVAGFQQAWKEMTYPLVASRSLGSRIWDVDGNEYVDLTMGFGSALFGHSPPFVREAIEAQLKKGMEIGPQSPIAGQVAAALCRMTGMERATFCNTGSEAVLGAVRAARTVTGRNRIVMFSGDYHGVNDEVLARGQAVGGRYRSFPIAPGIPPEMVKNVLVLDYGADQSLETIAAEAQQLAAVLVEPVQSRRPDLQPGPFLKRLRAITEQSGTALIFDEVITGFRLHPGGAQAWFDVKADLATYGKVVGGGMPIGVIAGRSAYMDAFDGGMWRYGDDSSPEAGVTFFAGTFVRHPLTMAAARAVMERLEGESPALQEELNHRAQRLVAEVNQLFHKAAVPVRLVHCGSLIYFDHADDLGFFSLFFYFLRENGVHIWEGRACFLSTAHSDDDLERLVAAFDRSIRGMQQGGFWPGPDGAPGAADHPGPAADATAGDSRAPVTEAQREIWLASQLSDTASCAFNESTVLHLRGPFQRQPMEAAIARMIERHQALRTTFDADGDFQYVQQAMAIDIAFEDLATMDDAGRQSRIKTVLDQEAGTPFDLVAGPLFRVRILKLAADYHLMVTTAHHIVCDGWSFDVMMRDLSHVYTLYCEGREDRRPLPMQITEYARWQQRQQESPEVREDLQYWLDQFAKSVPVLELPSDRPRPALKSYRGGRETRLLEREAYARIKEVGARRGATLFATLLAAYAVLLYRLSGRSDLVVGILAAGQSVVGSHDLVGHCTNLLPLRVRVDGARPFTELLREVKNLVLDAYEHQRVTFGTLVGKLDLRRDPSRTPLVSVLFNIDPAIHGMRFRDLDVEYVSNPRCAYQFDIGFNLIAADDRLISECDYATDLFDADTIHRWLGHYHTLIGGIINDPQRPVRELELLNDEERQQLLVEWNRTEMDYPRQAGLHQLFEAQAKRVPDARAVADEQGAIGYRDLDRRANQLAHHLRQLGVGRETFVGVCLHRNMDVVVSLLAILKAGGAYLPLDPAFPAARLEYMLEDSGAPVVITQTELVDRLDRCRGRLVVMDRDWEEIGGRPEQSPGVAVAPEDLAYLMYTSGSTGKPKGVLIPHRAVVNFLCSMQVEPGFSEADILLSVTTLSFDISVLEIFLPLATGGSTVLVSPETATDGHRLAQALGRSRATVIQATPVTYRILLECGWRPHGKLKALIGGEPVPRELCERLLAMGIELWNMYGPTETTIWSTVCRMEPGQERVSIGRPIGNTRVYVLDGKGRPVPVGVPGELHIGGDGVARGYLNRPRLSAEKFIADPFCHQPGARIYNTGDLALFLKDGRLQCLGRTDFQAKVRGFRVEPGEVETLLNRHPQVAQSAVVVRPDSLGENQLVAYLVAQPGASPGLGDLKQHLREQLPEYMIPARFVFVPNLPLTPNGKIDRNSLPAVPDDRQGRGESDYVAAGDALELQLSRIWESVLGVKPIGVRDNFFDLGGHSLLAARLFSQLKKALGVNLPLATLFRAPTIEQLAQVVRDQGGKADWSSLVPIQPGGSRPPLFFVHGAGGNVLLYRDLSRHLGPDQPFYGFQARGLGGNGPAYTRFEDMAAHYLAEMRRFQPQGPYYLGGYCLGGAIALEMAQQLAARGQETALLAMIETYNIQAGRGPLPARYEWYHRLQNLKYHWDNLWLLKRDDKLSFLKIKGGTTLRRTRARVTMRLARGARLLRLPWGEDHPHVGLTRINDRAHVDYRPARYPGKITLFRPQKHYAGYDDDDFGWGEVAAGGVEVHVLPVLPRGTLAEPFVRRLAAELAECLDRARREAAGQRRRG